MRRAINTAIALAERIGDNRLAVMVRAKRACIATDLGDDESAQSDMDWACARTRETGHKQMYMWTYGALGYIYWQREDWERALDLCAEQQRVLGYRPDAVYLAACLGLGRLHELTRATDASANRLNGGRICRSNGRPSTGPCWRRSWPSKARGMMGAPPQPAGSSRPSPRSKS